jgi:cystathionine beta-lyase/cystathionine gamma-synthase
LRFPQQCSNASKLALILDRSEFTERVWYPGLSIHDTHSVAKKLFQGAGYGAMVTFSFAGHTPEEKRRRRDLFIELVKDKIHLVPTLGDPHTMLMPVEPVWGHKYPDPGMIRVSVGFEPFGELSDTVNSALERIGSGG